MLANLMDLVSLTDLVSLIGLNPLVITHLYAHAHTFSVKQQLDELVKV